VPIFGLPVRAPDATVTGGTGRDGVVVVCAGAGVVVVADDVEVDDPEPDVVERPGVTCWLSGPPVTVVVVTVVVVVV